MKLNIEKQHLMIFFVAFACIFLALGNVLGFGMKTAVAFIGMAVVILSFSYPSVPLYILVLGIPLESKTDFLTLGKGINFTNIMLILMFIGWIMRVVIKKERMFFKNPLNIPILIYILIALFAFFRGSFYWGYELSGDVMTAFKQSMMIFIIFYFAVNCVRTDTERKILFFLIALMVCYEGTVAIRQHQGVEHSIYVTESRVTGTFGEEGKALGANELGAFFAMYAPLSLAGILVL
ncbi:hypothetical protein IIB34_06800, partial [PVC group bacterium]|nr:hypothetical protein [PVC group bacterium]